MLIGRLVSAVFLLQQVIFVEITGIQLEIGDSVTPLSMRTMELR